MGKEICGKSILMKELSQILVQPSTGEAKGSATSSANSSANRSRKNSAKLTAKEVPAAAYEAPDDWISYFDAETQQEYWYNTKTGETSWDR